MTAAGAAEREALERRLSERLAAVVGRIEAACQRVGRDPAEVTLVGVSKKQVAAVVAAGVRVGIVELGENFVQEARDKQPAVHGLLAEPGSAQPPAPRWRMIGRLQSNKARLAARIFDAVDTIDTPGLAAELGRRAEALGRTIEICLQVNVSGEGHKGGVAPEGVPALLDACRRIAALRVAGLMTIPAAALDPDDRGEGARPAFARLRELRDRLWPDFEDRDGHTLATLSMGMSADFEIAIEEGATQVRVGTALFGSRPAPAAALNPAVGTDPTE